MNYRIFVGVFVCLFTLAVVAELGDTKCKGGDPEDMETLFSELQQLANARSATLDHATASDHLKREKEIQQEYLNRGSEGIMFLLNKLSAINEREKSFIHGPDDVDGGLQFLASEAEAGRTLLVRYAVCYILSDMYPKASAIQRKEIVHGIVGSFLPSTQGREDIETMDGALFRMGKDGLKGFLELASSQSEFNRCHASLILMGLGKAARLKLTARRRYRAEPDQ